MRLASTALGTSSKVQQAYLHATGRTREPAHFRPDILNEDLSGLSRRGYVDVGGGPDLAKLASVLPGDIVAFAPPPPKPGEQRQVGHRTIVFDPRVATSDDMNVLLQAENKGTFMRGGPVRILEMDSSWGNGIRVGNQNLGDPVRVGVQRQTRIFNEASGSWAILLLERERDGEAKFVLQEISSLYIGHALEGVYRRKGD